MHTCRQPHVAGKLIRDIERSAVLGARLSSVIHSRRGDVRVAHPLLHLLQILVVFKGVGDRRCVQRMRPKPSMLIPNTPADFIRTR